MMEVGQTLGDEAGQTWGDKVNTTRSVLSQRPSGLHTFSSMIHSSNKWRLGVR